MEFRQELRKEIREVIQTPLTTVGRITADLARMQGHPRRDRDFHDDANLHGARPGKQGVNSDSKVDDDGLYMVRRNLCTHKRDIDKKKFRTRCTVHERVCDLVIDDDNTENYVSKYMVEKLKLTIEKHPNPYKGWLNDMGEIMVNKRCMIPFSIGKSYKDEAVCDIVDMTMCHMILGHPWKFDRKAHHDERLNTYTFVKNKVRTILVPLSGEKQAQTPNLEQEILQEVRNFKTEITNTNESNVLEVKEEVVVPINVPVESELIVVESKSIRSVDLQKELPLMHDIHHRIDLVRVTHLPNLSQYQQDLDCNSKLTARQGVTNININNTKIQTQAGPRQHTHHNNQTPAAPVTNLYAAPMPVKCYRSGEKEKEELISDFMEEKRLDEINLKEVQQIDFIGFDNFFAVFNSFLVNIMNKLKITLKIFWVAQFMENIYIKRLKNQIYSKYLICWSEKIQYLKTNSSDLIAYHPPSFIPTLNSRSSSFQEGVHDVGG